MPLLLQRAQPAVYELVHLELDVDELIQLTLDPADPAAAGQWQDYLTGWTRWNHVRTLTSLGAAAAFSTALLRS